MNRYIEYGNDAPTHFLFFFLISEIIKCIDNEVSSDNSNNFILLVMGKRDSCATFLEQFENVEYYEHTEELRASASSP